MDRANRGWWAMGGALLALALCGAGPGAAAQAEAAGPQEKPHVLAKGARASRPRFVHRVELKDDKGNILAADSTVPYSPRQTCASGKCHSYETVAKGSHTQMYPTLRPDRQFGTAHAWTVYDRLSGTHAPLSHGLLPRPGVEADPKLYWTPYRFVQEFGAYHPGGGRLELDATGQRYDTRLLADKTLDSPANPDYYKAPWNQSGVLEIDCLVCHARSDYDHVERGREISEGRFKWAATVGAGFGTVAKGSGEMPFEVHYKPGLFDAHGKVEAAVGRPIDRNCLFCHRMPIRGKTSWRDACDSDVHSKSGLACADCHRGGPDHIRFGDRRAKASLTQSPDYASLTCQGCHDSGRLGSPIPKHEGLPPIHIDRISCEACHAGPAPRVLPLACEQPTDYKWGTPRYIGLPAGPTVWTPILKRGESDKIYPFKRLLPAFFMRRLDDGRLEPIRLTIVRSRVNKVTEQLQLHDDDGDGDPEANTEAEIAALLTALTKKSKRKGRSVLPLFFVGGRAYSLDSSAKDKKQWSLRSEPSALADPVDVPMAHSVRPAGQSIGAKDCSECHAANSPFFRSVGLTRALGPDGKPVGKPLYEREGYTAAGLDLDGVRGRYLKTHAAWVTVLGALNQPARGETSWRDCLGADVHAKAGLECADCHRGGSEYIVARGQTRDPGLKTLSCQECHDAGQDGAPVPQHEGLPAFHLEKVSCETCHSGPRPRKTPLAFEQPTDPTWGTARRIGDLGGPRVFAPVFVEDEAGTLQVKRRLLPAIYARRTDDGVELLPTAAVANCFKALEGQIEDDDEDGEPEVNTDGEILVLLKALRKAKAGGQSIDPVYYVGGTAYSLDASDPDEANWTLQTEKSPVADPIDVPLAHNVRPAEQSLGATGCTECHAAAAPFFQSVGVTRALGDDAKPVGDALYVRTGKTALDVYLGAFREEWLRPYAPWVILATVLAMALHFVLFGPHRYPHKDREVLVQRFNVSSRVAHFALLLSFLVLATTGLCIAAGVDHVLGIPAEGTHEVVSFVLMGAMALAFLLWVKDMVFSRVDIQWLSVLGNYLGFGAHARAGRFNAGQKFFFWMILAVVACLAATGLIMMYEWPAGLLPLAYTLHELCAYFMILSILGHAYLGSFANPGTIGAPFTGEVTAAWLKYHHPDYKPRAKP